MLMLCCCLRRARAFIHFRRRARGRRRRETIAVRRIQSWWRFLRFRFKVRRVADARVYVIYRWRKYYRRKYGAHARVLQALYRRNRVKLCARFLQRMMKGALGRRAFLRKKLEVLAIERARNSRECVAVTRKLRNMSGNMGWVEDEKQVPPVAIADHMRRLDVYAMAVLEANALQFDEDFSCLHPAEYECENEELVGYAVRASSTAQDSLSKRIVIALLNIFVNRPGECLDHTALQVSREYLKPISRRGVRFEEAWENLHKYPMVNVAGLCQVLEPTSALLKKVQVSGRSKYLPVEVVAKAVLVYRWTVHYEWATKQAVIGFRVTNKPRRVCPKCQYPMTFDGELLDHRVCFNNGSYMAWMSKDLDSCRQALYRLCCDPKTFKVPDMKRDVTGDKVKLSNADLAETKAKHENFRTAQCKDFTEGGEDDAAVDQDQDQEGDAAGKKPTSPHKAKRLESSDSGKKKKSKKK